MTTTSAPTPPLPPVPQVAPPPVPVPVPAPAPVVKQDLPPVQRERLTPETYNLDFYSADELMGRSPGARWVDKEFATKANAFGKEFFELTGKRITINEPHKFDADPFGVYKTQGRRRGTREPGDNPGVPGSEHLNGIAADFQIQHLTDTEKALAYKLATEKHGFTGVGFYEDGPGHVHFDLGAKRSWGKRPAWADLTVDPANFKSAFKGTRPPEEARPAATPASPIDNPKIPYEVREAILYAHNETKLPVSFLTRAAFRESTFNPGLITPNKTNPNNPASGLFQMMPQSSWKHMVELHGAKYGITEKDIMNPRANALMAAHLSVFNAEMFEKRLGRRPSEGEMYVQHVMGGSGGIKLTTLASENPNGIAAESFSSAAFNNKAIFYEKDGRARTLKEVYDILVKKGTDDDTFTAAAIKSVPQVVPGDRPIVQAELGIPAPQTMEETYNAKKAVAEREANLSFWSDGIPAAFRTNTATYLFDAAQAWGKAPDPDWKLGPEELKQIQNYPDELRDRFFMSHSREHFEDMISKINREVEAAKVLQDLGGYGIAATLTSEMLDPVALGASIATGGMLAPYVGAAKLGRAGTVLAAAAVGGVSEATGEAAAMVFNPNKDWDDVVMAGAFGGVIGGTVGAFIPTGLEQTMRRAAAGTSKTIDGSTTPTMPDAGSGGARFVGGGNLQFQGDKEWLSIQGSDVPYTAMKDAPQLASAAQLQKSPNPASRLANLAENPIGMEGHRVNPIAPSEEQLNLFREKMSAYSQMYLPAFRQYMNDLDLPWYERIYPRKHLDDFNLKVDEYIRDTSGIRDMKGYEDTVQRVGNQIIKLQQDLANIAREVGLPGFEKGMDSANYLMRMFNHEAIGRLRKRFGDPAMVQLIEGAIRKAQPQIKDKLLKKLAKGYYKGIAERAHGLDDRVSRMFSGDLVDEIEDVLRGLDAELDDMEIAEVVDMLRPKESDGASPRGKKRILLDENYFIDAPTKSGTGVERLNFKDLLVRDADFLFRMYSRQMSGHIALAKFQIVNPTTGAMLVDGLKRDADFEKLIRDVQKTGIEKIGMSYKDSGQMDKDIANLRFQYNAIKGRPHHTAFGQTLEGQKWTRVLNLWDSYNVLRLMGQMGFAQTNEAALVAHTTGLTAMFKHIPSFRRIATMDGREVLRSGLAREIEAMGIGIDNLLGKYAYGTPDLVESGINPTPSPLLSKLERAKDFLGRGLAYGSGMAFIDTALERMAAAAVLQNFADYAKDSVKKAVTTKTVQVGVNRQVVNTAPTPLPDGTGQKILDWAKKQKNKPFTKASDPSTPEYQAIQKVLNDLSDSFQTGFRVKLIEVNQHKSKADGTLWAMPRTSGGDDVVISINRGFSKEKALGIALHEFGHFHDKLMLKKAPKATQDEILDAWARSTKIYDTKTIEEIRPLVYSGDTAILSASSAKYQKYIKSFEEWYADQVSTWIAKNAEPVSGIEKFFSGIAQFWKDLYSRITGHVPVEKEIDDFLRKGYLPPEKIIETPIFKGVQETTYSVDLSKISKTDMKRYRALGLSDEDLEEIFIEMAKHSTNEPWLAGERLAQLNIDKWDSRAAHSMKMALFRSVRRMIQENDVGTMNRWMSHPLVKTMLLFRTFMLGAYSKNLLHNAHLGGGVLAGHMAVSSMVAALSYMTQQSINNTLQGRPQGQGLSAWDIGRASFARAGYATFLPALLDTGLGFLGMDPMFAYRASGQPSSLWAMPPSLRQFDDLYQGAQSVGRLVAGAPATKQDLKNIRYTLPFANTVMMTGVFGAMGGGLPDKPTKADRYKY